MTAQELEGRIAIVTGARRGIGAAIARRLHQDGAKVAALDIEPPELDGIEGIVCDVTDEDAVDRAVSEVERRLGSVSIAVLNAGILPVVSLEETSRELWDRTFAVNLTGAFLVMKRVLPAMREAQYGRLLAVGSSAGKTGGAANLAAYAASKAGIMALAKSVASEYAREGITSNAIAPAQIDTDMLKGLPDLSGRIPVGRYGTPEEVAALVAFLVSPMAGYITGEVVDINGGFLID